MSDPAAGSDRAFPSIPLNRRQAKPREVGLTEIRGPIYAPMGINYLMDLFSTMGPYVDSFKFGAAAFALMPRQAVKEMVDLCHEHDVKVSTGGAMETVLRAGAATVEPYLEECVALGFDIVEISSGFLSIPFDDILRLVQVTLEAGLTPKPEISVQFGAGGTSTAEALEEAGQIDLNWAVKCAKDCLEAGAPLVMLESEGVTEAVKEWRTEVPARFASEIGLDKVMFEAADPVVYGWYVKQFGPEVNLFIDHTQIINLECLRTGLWGTSDLWGRVVTFKGFDDAD